MKYDYTIYKHNSPEVFRRTCDYLSNLFPEFIKGELLVDVDGSTIQVFGNRDQEIVVYDDYDVGAVFVKSDIELFSDGLDPILDERHDPIEDTEEYKVVVEIVDRKARELVKAQVDREVEEYGDEEFIRSLPTGHIFASAKKRILKEEYGIDWKSPIEMNPHIIYD